MSAAALDVLRAELRALYLAATVGRGGRWEAVPVGGADQVHLYGVTPAGGRWLIAMPRTLADARLIAAGVSTFHRPRAAGHVAACSMARTAARSHATHDGPATTRTTRPHGQR